MNQAERITARIKNDVMALLDDELKGLHGDRNHVPLGEYRQIGWDVMLALADALKFCAETFVDKEEALDLLNKTAIGFQIGFDDSHSLEAFVLEWNAKRN